MAKRESDRPVYSREELFKKEKNKEPMTYEEVEALKREKQKDLTNQILRISGLFAILFVVILAVGCFLYPFSLFNLFGKSRFWDCYNHFPVHAGGAWRTLSDVIDTVVHSGVYQDTGESVGFIDVFYMIGSWTIPVLATVGFVAIILYAVYIVVYNIRDLISVIRHFIHRVGNVTSDISSTAVESVVDSTKADAFEAVKR